MLIITSKVLMFVGKTIGSLLAVLIGQFVMMTLNVPLITAKIGILGSLCFILLIYHFHDPTCLLHLR